MKLYNTLTRQKEEFNELKSGTVTIYACGPTVYDFFHIGNARPFIIFDVLRRYLEFKGKKVRFVQNFTDIDDKMIARANDEGISVFELGNRFIEEYFNDAKELGVKKATVHPRATECIEDIIKLVQRLIDKGMAYESGGDVFYSTNKFAEYGKLSHYPIEQLESGARIEVNDHKQNPMDFVVWKAAKPSEPAWDSPWGKGRPGWHIECSAMAGKYLGETIDIHCGGVDLIFPHHENEIAQSEAANGKPFARFWLHNGHINADSRKMSKSKGNFFTVRDAAGLYGYEAIRFFMLSGHYRSPINYNVTALEAAAAGLERLYTVKENLEYEIKRTNQNKKCPDTALSQYDVFKERFIERMDDDINTADAVSVLFDMARKINIDLNGAKEPQQGYFAALYERFMELCAVLNILTQTRKQQIPDNAKALIEQRRLAREQRDFAKADKIRETLNEMGILLEDTKEGTKVFVKNKAGL